MTRTAPPAGLWNRIRQSMPGKASVRLARRLIDGCHERYLNVDTISLHGLHLPGGGVHGDALRYEALVYPFLGKCLDALELTPDDVVFEIGCGMGRTVCLLARRRISKCVGIELSQVLSERARINAATMRGHRAQVEIITGDAALADYSQATALYFFNPFGAATMKTVLDRVRSALAQNSRKIRIMYVLPCHEDVLASSGWLTCTKRLKSRWFSMQASCWESR